MDNNVNPSEPGVPTFVRGFVENSIQLFLPLMVMVVAPQWQYILMEFGLAWFVALVVGTLSFMLSVLIKSTAAGMGVMLACLISGTILSNMVSAWESAKYLFMVNLELINYLEGNALILMGCL